MNIEQTSSSTETPAQKAERIDKSFREKTETFFDSLRKEKGRHSGSIAIRYNETIRFFSDITHKEPNTYEAQSRINEDSKIALMGIIDRVGKIIEKNSAFTNGIDNEAILGVIEKYKQNISEYSRISEKLKGDILKELSLIEKEATELEDPQDQYSRHRLELTVIYNRLMSFEENIMKERQPEEFENDGSPIKERQDVNSVWRNTIIDRLGAK